MKKILLILLILQILVQTNCISAKPTSAQRIWDGSADTKWYKKSQNEFTITTAEQLAGLAKLVNKGNDFMGKTVMLGADIMLNDTAGWQDWASKPPKNEWKPIGTYIAKIDERTPDFLKGRHGDGLIMYFLVPGFIKRALRITKTDLPFGGTFDGGGFVVSGVYINALDSYQGLFGKISAIRNSELKNLGVRASYIKGLGGVGGLVGISDGKVNGCYSAAWVAGTWAGGLVGHSYYSSAIINSYSTGTVTGVNYVGGLVGSNSGTISNSYFAGTVTGDSWVGSLVGLNSGSIAGNNYYNMETDKQSLYGIGKGVGRGKPKTAEELKQQSTFAGWDFDNIWEIDSTANGGYPYLRNSPRKTE